MQAVSQQGLRATYRKVSDRLDSYTPLGYSLCGEVVEVGAGVEDLTIGQQVACAGNSYALHAEYNWVPRNLCVPLPEGVAGEHAAFTTVGAIAMQGYRQSEARLGETACVIGLGLVGQLLVQILRAAGVNVVGLDPSPDRCRLAEQSGAAACRPPTQPPATPCSRPSPTSPTAPEPTTSSSPPAVTPTSRSSSPPSWLATGPGSSTSADAASTCPGPSTTPRNWTSASRARTARDATIRPTRRVGSTTDWLRPLDRAAQHGLLPRPGGRGPPRPRPARLAVLPFDDAVAAYERIQNGEQGGVGMLFRYAANGSTQRRLGTAAPTRPTRQPGARRWCGSA